jgi:hypothetical protein
MLAKVPVAVNETCLMGPITCRPYQWRGVSGGQHRVHSFVDKVSTGIGVGVRHHCQP